LKHYFSVRLRGLLQLLLHNLPTYHPYDFFILIKLLLFIIDVNLVAGILELI